MYVFVGGTPAAGKTVTTLEFVKNSKLPIHHVGIDDFRKEWSTNPELAYWVNFLWNKNEEEYWNSTSYEEYTSHLTSQAEAFWPYVKKIVEETKQNHTNAIFEGVNLLPHLVKEYTADKALFLIQEDENVVWERIKKAPRWGNADHLKKLEAHFFVEYDARFIKEEAKKNNLPVFTSPQALVDELNKIFSF